MFRYFGTSRFYADPLPDSFFPVYEKWAHREITGKQAAEEMGVSFNQFEWMKRKYKKRLKAEHEE